MSRGVTKKEQRRRLASEELRRIENGVPVLLENIEYIPDKQGVRSLLVLTRAAHERDKRNFILRWLVPTSAKRQIRLDPYGTFVAGMIDGKSSTLGIAAAFSQKFKVDAKQARENCLLFLHSLARRGLIAIVEREGRGAARKS